MGGESVQLSQAQKRRMEAMSMNMGTRIVCGYLASLLFLGISLYLAVTYHTSGDLQSFWCYLALAAICLTPEMCGMCFSVMRRRPGLYPSEPF